MNSAWIIVIMIYTLYRTEIGIMPHDSYLIYIVNKDLSQSEPR